MIFFSRYFFLESQFSFSTNLDYSVSASSFVHSFVLSYVRSFLCSFFLGFLCFFFCFVRGCCFIIATINAVKERSTSHLELELISPFHRQRKGPWLSEFCPKQETNGRNTL